MKKFKDLTFVLLLFLFAACSKENTDINITSDDAQQMRKGYTDKGYIEVIVDPIMKTYCYFAEWDKTILTPVSGLIEYYDNNNTWVASIDFGDGTCDQWATKSWDINIFPDYPSGSEDFSVFEIKDKKD